MYLFMNLCIRILVILVMERSPCNTHENQTFSKDTLDIKTLLPKDDGISYYWWISGAGKTYNIHKASFGHVITDHTESIFKDTTQLRHTIPTKDNFTISYFLHLG